MRREAHDSSESNARSTRKLEETHAHMLKLMQTIVRTGERSEVEGVTEHQIDAWECFSLESINTVREILGDQGEPEYAHSYLGRPRADVDVAKRLTQLSWKIHNVE